MDAAGQRALLEQMLQHAETIQQNYLPSYDLGGQIRSWTSYYASTQTLKRAQAQFNSAYKSFHASQPVLAQRITESLNAIEQHLAAKAHPSLLGSEAYRLIRDIYLADPSVIPKALTTYHRTIDRLSGQFVSEAVQGDYRVGLILEQPRTIYKLYQTPNRNLRILRADNAFSANQALRVVLRHAKTGDILSGTHVSIELLDAKTKKQQWSRKMYEIWDGYPAYVLPVKLPAGKTFILQVTVSPFPVSRTPKSFNALRGGAEMRFSATMKGGNLEVAKATNLPPLQWRGGLDLLEALAETGGNWRDSGPYRMGFAIKHPRQVYTWKLGSLKKRHLMRPNNGEIFVFLQDKRTGMLIPSRRLKAFVYWQSPYGRYRSSFRLKPVYNGYAGYQAPMALLPMRYDVEISVMPALISSFHPQIPVNFLIEFKEYAPHMIPYKKVIRKKRR